MKPAFWYKDGFLRKTTSSIWASYGLCWTDINQKTLGAVIPMLHVNVGPCHDNMVHPWVADGVDGLHIWRVAANITNKQL